jgi:hypothetical protein
MRSALLLLAPAPLLVACGSPPAPAPIAKPAASVSASVAVAPPPPSRWIETGSLNDVGTPSSDGTPLVVGGRRAVLAPDGTFKLPATPTPEPLEEIVEVHSSAGKRLVARGERTLYRIDDLLGEAKPIAEAAANYTNVDPGPGVVAAWTTSSELPTYIDIETGNASSLAGLPVAPVRSMAFVDVKRGAAVFAALGLATTTDGGATWRAVTDVGGGALRTKGVAARDGGLVAMRDDRGGWLQVDPAAGTLGPETPHTLPSNDAAPIVRWIARTHRDPLEAAITSGIATPNGAAIAVSRGYVARIDLATGAILELLDLSSDLQADSCSIARTGDTALVACGASGTAPSHIFSIALARSPLAAEKPIVTGTSSRLRSSPSGGVMLPGPCKQGNDGYACVRQPDGKWATIDAPVERDGSSTYDRQNGVPTSYGVGPLADGGVAYLAPYHDDEDPPAAGGSSTGPRYEHGQLRVVVIEGSGMHRKMPAIEYDDPNGPLRVVGSIEEDEHHILRVVVVDDNGPIVVAQGSTGSASARRVDGASAARVHGMRGIALGTRRLLESTDGGGTWAETTTPAHVFASLGSVFGAESDASKLVLSDNGVRLAGHLRVGWGELESSEASSNAPDAPTNAPSSRRFPPPQLTCKTIGTTASAGDPTTSAEVDKAFGVVAPPKGTRRVSAPWASPSVTAGVTRILFEVEGPEKAPHPTAWKLHWMNSGEVGARARSWSGAAPKDASWSPAVRNGAATGDRMFTFLADGGRDFVARTGASGATEIVDLHSTTLAPGQVTLGTHTGDPAAWWRNLTVVAVPQGGVPVTIGGLGPDVRATVTVGSPTKDGVPVFVGTNEWSMMRIFPVPPPTKGVSTVSPLPSDPVPTALLDGWVAIPFHPRAAASLPVCTAKSLGSQFAFDGQAYLLHVDGASENGYSTRADVRVAGADACVSALSTTFHGVTAPHTPADPKLPKKPGGPVTFLRADLVAKSAEGGDVAGGVRRLDCSLAPK